MTAVLLVEGATETALKKHLKRFLDQRAEWEGKQKLALRAKPFRMMLRQDHLRKRIQLELKDSRVTAVIGLVDVYPTFASADEAKEYLRCAAGNDERFYAHAAQYDVEAWLLPYWNVICNRLGVHRTRPRNHPEQVNNLSPPSKHLEKLYRLAKRKYKKPLEMTAILEKQDLGVAARECQELRLFLNTLLQLGDFTLL